jgi:hypothetical protein
MIRKLTLMTFMLVFGVALFAASSTTAQAQKTKSLPTEITRNKTLKKKNIWILEGGTFVRSGATLKIKPGTTIVGKPGSFLVVDKGAKIQAVGTAEKPIIFTSIQAPGNRHPGDWGGLIFNGNAPVNCAGAAGGTCEGEGGTGSYGGSDPADNQGVLKYVRVEFGGFAISPDNELNCIAFQGVGNGTEVDFVEGLYGGDDAFEFFGGTVNAKHLVAVGTVDDNIDWTFGWQGKLQFVVAQQRTDQPLTADPRGIEADNNEGMHDITPRSHPLVANITLVGDPDAGEVGTNEGVRLRRGTGGEIRNLIGQNFKLEGLRIVDPATFTQLADGGLDIQGVILFDNKSGSNMDGATKTALEGKGLPTLKIQDQLDPELTNPFNRTAPNFRPQAGSPALDAANVAPTFNDPFFVAAPYVGAFDGTTDWTAGWTSFASN